MYIKHHVLGNETTFPVTRLLNVYDRAWHENAKKHRKLIIYENKPCDF